MGSATIVLFPKDESVKYSPADPVEIYRQQLKRQYKIIGKVSAKSEDFGEDTLFDMLKKKAIALRLRDNLSLLEVRARGTPVVAYPIYGGGATVIPITSTRPEGIAIRFGDQGYETAQH